MPQVPYDAVPDVGAGSVNPAFQTANNADPSAFGAGIAQSLGGLGQQIEKTGTSLADIFIQRQAQTQEFNAAAGLNALNNDLNKFYMEQSRAANPDGNGFAETITKGFQERAAQFEQSLPEYMRPAYRNRIDGLKGQYVNKAIAEQFKMQDTHFGTKVVDSLSEQQQVLDRDPSQLENSKRLIGELIMKSAWPNDLKEAQAKQATILLEATAYKTEVRRNPKGMVGALGVGEGANIEAVTDRIIGVESGGKATAKNPNSTALGSGQFIARTWLSMVRQYRPELAAGKSEAEILAMRTDPVLSREMTKAYAVQNTEKLRRAGINPSPGNVYLAHFLGPAGAIALLSVDPSTPVERVVDPDAIKANSSILGSDRTVGEVMAWADKKMGGQGTVSVDPRFANIPYTQRVALARDAQTQADQLESQRVAAQAREVTLAVNQLKLDIDLGRRGLSDIVQLEQTGNIGPDQSLMLRNYLEAQEKKTAVLREGQTKLSDPGAQWNRFEDDDKARVKAISEQAGKIVSNPDEKAAIDFALYERTRIMPPDMIATLRNASVSQDPKAMQRGMQYVSNILARDVNAFAGVDGGSELAALGTEFNRLTNDLGMTAQQASAELAKRNDPEYKLRNAPKEEQVAKFRQELRADASKEILNEVKPALFDRWFGSMPQADRLGMDEKQKDRIMADYAEFAVRGYGRYGDKAQAKAYALGEIKRMYAPTVGNRVMQYPPELASGYEVINGSKRWVYEQAAFDIAARTAKPVKPEDIVLYPIPNVTREAFTQGQPVPYQVLYKTKDELGFEKWELLTKKNSFEGATFVADPKLVKRQPELGFMQKVEDFVTGTPDQVESRIINRDSPLGRATIQRQQQRRRERGEDFYITGGEM